MKLLKKKFAIKIVVFQIELINDDKNILTQNNKKIEKVTKSCINFRMAICGYMSEHVGHQSM